MLKKLRDELSEKTKLIVYIGITAAVFLTACLLPLAFRDKGDTSDIYFDTGERAAMFLQYQSGSKDIQSKVLDSVSSSEKKTCETKMNSLVSFCRIDNKSGKSITEGSEYIQLSDGDNVLRLCRMWKQDEGDWTNWMDVYFDMDTGFVYYLYVSSVCLNNTSDYIGVMDSSFNTKAVANLVAEQSGSVLKHFSWSGNAEDSGYAVTSIGGDTVCWNIYCSYYEATMLDVKIIVA